MTKRTVWPTLALTTLILSTPTLSFAMDNGNDGEQRLAPAAPQRNAEGFDPAYTEANKKDFLALAHDPRALELTKTHIERGMDPNVHMGTPSQTALMKAATTFGGQKVVEFLLKNKAQYDLRDTYGFTAATLVHKHIQKLNQNLESETDEGKKIVFTRKIDSATACQKILLDRFYGDFSRAAQNKDMSAQDFDALVQEARANGFNINRTNGYGATPLMLSVMAETPHYKALLNAGVNPHAAIHTVTKAGELTYIPAGATALSMAQSMYALAKSYVGNDQYRDKKDRYEALMAYAEEVIKFLVKNTMPVELVA